MNQPVTELQLQGKDEPELLAMIASVSQELAHLRPYQNDHQITAEGLDTLRKVLFEVRTRSWMRRSKIGRSR